LEDHPEEDGTPYWGIVHGLEAVGSYEAILHDSLLRRPSFFGALLANRILNAGEGLDWIPSTFDLILASDSTPPRVRQTLATFVARIPKTNGEQDVHGNTHSPLCYPCSQLISTLTPRSTLAPASGCAITLTIGRRSPNRRMGAAPILRPPGPRQSRPVCGFSSGPIR
jgi:hypothetical protein